MSDDGGDSAMYKPMRVPLGAWSRTEYLYIQLYSELLLAIAYLPTAPCPSIDNISQYISYCQYFAALDAATDDSLAEASSDVLKSVNTFIDKRDELSGSVMWAIQAMKMKAFTKGASSKLYKVEVSPAMLQKYRQIRERMGFDTYVDNPKLYPALWSFLQDSARSLFPEFSGDASQAELTRDVDTNASMAIGSSSIVGSVLDNDPADTSDHELLDEADMSAADDDTNSGATHEPGQADPEGFTKKKVTTKCTETNKDGKACERTSTDVEEKDRRTWLCHNHDPVKKRITAAARAERNAAAKKAAKAKPKQKKSHDKEQTGEETKAGTKRTRKTATAGEEAIVQPRKKHSQ